MFNRVDGARRNILILSSDPGHNIFEIRLRQPLRGLAEQMGWSWRALPFDGVHLQDLRWSDVVVIQRATQIRELALIEWLREEGIPVVYEIDDLLTQPAQHLISIDELTASAPVVAGMLSAVDAVSASTPRLVANLLYLNASVSLVPNYGPVHPMDVAQHDDVSSVTLVVAASDRQLIAAMAAGIQTVQADPSFRVEVVAFAAIADCLAQAGVACRHMPMMPRDEFFKAVAALRNPIGLIPLDDSIFSSCKSAVKYFDYSCLGIPCICSRVPPYADVVHDGRDGLLCADHVDDWANAIRGLASDASRRTQLASAAKLKVETFYSLGHAQAAWRELLVRMFALGVKTRRPLPLSVWLHEGLTQQAQAARSALREWDRQRRRNRDRRRVTTS